MASAISSLGACSSPEADTRSTPVLVGSEPSAADTMSTVLVALQRKLLSGVAAGDTAVLSQLISGSFTAHDVHAAGAGNPAGGNGDGSRQFSYLDVLSGRLGGAVASDYGTYRAVPNGETALVYAFRADHAVQVQWHYRSGRWQASRLIILRPEDARAMLDMLQS